MNKGSFRAVLEKGMVLLLACLLVLGALPACGYVGSEAEVLAAASGIFEHMTWISNALYGEGIEAKDPQSGVYGEAVSLPGFLGGKTVDSFKAYLEGIFSRELYSLTEYSIFESVKSDTGILVSYARYYDYLTDEGDSYFMVNTNYEPLVQGRMEFDPESLAFVSSSPNRAVVSVDVDVIYTPTEGETQIQHHPALSMDLVYEDGVWKLDTAPYMNYDPEWEQNG